MKEVVNGKTYNTETSEEITHASQYRNGLLLKRETLYKTDGNAYFKTAVFCNRNFFKIVIDNYIEPLDLEQAKDFCEGLLTTAEEKAAFGEEEIK